MKIFKILIFLIIMAVVNWGLLNKSGSDSETIEQAINRLITVHEGDASAHLGAGESLEAHKNADIIDHPAGSVVADKFTDREIVWQNFFTNSLVWTSYGNYNYFGGGGVDLNFDGDATPCQIHGGPIDGNFSVFSGSDFTAQYTVLFGRDGTTSRFLLGVSESISYVAGSEPTRGFYFEMINNSMRGKIRYGGNTYQTEAFTPANWEHMILRIFYDATAQTVSFYVNGALLGTIDASGFSGGISYPLMARVESTDAVNLYTMELVSMSFTKYFAPPF